MLDSTTEIEWQIFTTFSRGADHNVEEDQVRLDDMGECGMRVDAGGGSRHEMQDAVVPRVRSCGRRGEESVHNGTLQRRGGGLIQPSRGEAYGLVESRFGS